MNRQVAAREAGDCAAPRICCSWRAAAAMLFSHSLLSRGGAARAVVHGFAVNNGKRRRKPPLSPHCAKRNAARVPRPADFAEVRRMGEICTCAENAAFGGVGEGARAGKAAARYRSAFAKGADGVYIKGSAE